MLDQRAELTHKVDTRPLAELVPWMLLLTPSIVLNKDGALMACFSIEGQDTEGVEPDEIDWLADQVDRAYAGLGGSMRVWWTLERERMRSRIAGNFTNPVSAAIHDSYQAHQDLGNQYITRAYLGLVLAPEGGAHSLISDILRHAQKGEGWLKAIVGGMKQAVSKKGQFQVDLDQIRSSIETLEDAAAMFANALSDVRLNRLEGKDLLGFLHGLASPASERQLVPAGDPDLYLDTRLGNNELVPTRNYLRFEGTKERFGAVLSVKQWPTRRDSEGDVDSMTWPGALDGLLEVDAPLRLTLVHKVVEREAAKKFISDVRRHHLNLRKGLMALVMETLTNTESEMVNQDRAQAAAEADAALTGLASMVAPGYLNVSITVWGDSPDELAVNVNNTTQKLSEAGWVVSRERLHQLSAWAGSLHGQHYEPVRWIMTDGRNVSDLAPVRTIRTGERVNRYLSEQVGRTMPALATLPTPTGAPYYFNFHVGDLGHSFVVGPSRTGKSVFVNFLLSQWQKYAPCNVFIFDKDRSAYIPTQLQGGQYLEVDAESLCLNPAANLETDRDWTWFTTWLELILGLHGYQLTAADQKHLTEAVESLQQVSPENRRLSTVASLLPTHLAEQLHPWVGNGRWGKHFDNSEDGFSLSDFMAIGMNAIMEDPTLARAFLDYAFYRIDRQLDGRPTVIYLEEAWILLAHEGFVFKVVDWMKTLAKKNANLVLATQSLEEVSDSTAFASLVDNMATWVFLPNPAALAHVDLYRGRFGLNNTQIDMIRKAAPKRDYIIYRPWERLTRLVQPRFDARTLAHLRSDARALSIFERYRREGSDNWRERYIEEVSNA